MRTLDIERKNLTEEAPSKAAIKESAPLYFLCNTARRTIWLVVSFSLMLFALEGIFALAHFGEEEYLRIDPLLGLVHLENKDVTWREEGYSREHLNHSGFFDIEHPLKKAPGAFRIAILGDSFTEALQLPAQFRFTNLLEDKFNSKGLKRFEVFNCGISGFGSGQEYLLYLSKIKDYQPDLVILCLNQWEPDKNTQWPAHPVFSLSKTGQLQTSWANFDQWRKSPAALPFVSFDWARRNSRVWGVLLQSLNNLKTDPTFQKLSGVLSTAEEAMGKRAKNTAKQTDLASGSDESKLKISREILCKSGNLTTLDRVPTNTEAISVEERWQITGATIKQFATACSRQHCGLVIVAIPVRWQKDALRDRFASIATLTANFSLPLLNLIPSFVDQQTKSNDALFLEGHFTARGHELVADALYSFLENNYLSKSESNGVIDRR
jgi:lysophospholipase L1-like esterase